MSENRIDQQFKSLKAAKQPAFIPYITAGDPSLNATEELVYALERGGADIIELGVPYSDPIGDGAVIQDAAQRALAQGVCLADIFDTIRNIRQQSQIPLLLFTYFNPVFAYGFQRFATDAAAAGADGVLCVDLPPEEGEDYVRQLEAAGLRTVFLVAPTTTEMRLATIAQRSTGFIYYVSRLGVTGERADLEVGLKDAMKRIRKHTQKPIAIGFGISTPDQAREVGGYADGVVVGSAIVKLIASLGDKPETAGKVEAFAKSLSDAAKGT